jgi:hypothetical protein
LFTSTVCKVTAFDLQDFKNGRFKSARCLLSRIHLPKEVFTSIESLFIKEPNSRSMIDLELYAMVKIGFVKRVS